ncbi:MAG: BatA and WFA domain-containing protein [Candidatus Omnitrophica bacterium]|nr:BatA and WFA domain-containing protein [Candidatus Omnitrophota bacterium]
MSASLLAPFMISGIVLAAVPWLIHRIRRPERETMFFSSLMFIPAAARKRIERQSLQHILLMMLRMLGLILLAIAFSRPYFFWEATSLNQTEGASHIILMDVSASMNAGHRMADARREALAILDSMQPIDRCALIVFDRKPDILVPLPQNAGDLALNRSRMRQKIASLAPGHLTTSYLSALQSAQEMLAADDSGNQEQPRRKIIHLISDFQKTGLSSFERRWALSSQIDFNPIAVGAPQDNHFSITDIGVPKKLTNRFLIMAQIKNTHPSSQDESLCRIRLFLNGEEKESREVFMAAGHSSKTSFAIDMPEEKSFYGWIEAAPDSFPTDDKRYFAWNSSSPKQVWLAAAQPGETPPWPPSFFLKSALQIDGNRQWIVHEKSFDELEQALPGAPPDILILCGMNTINQTQIKAVFNYLRQGGGAMLLLDEHAARPPFSLEFLQPLGLHAEGWRSTDANTPTRETFSWIDFEHPIFYSFRGSEFNDFTSIFFSHYLVLEEPSPQTAEMNLKTIARFENSNPAIIIQKHDKGRLLIWAFTPDVRYTNLPKNSRFVPLLWVSLNQLADHEERQDSYLVGDILDPSMPSSNENDRWLITSSNPQTTAALRSDSTPAKFRRASEPGWIQWRRESHPDDSIVCAVNIDAKEADFSAIPIEQFRQKFAASSQDEIPGRSDDSIVDNQQIIHHEWGRILLFFLLVLLFAETLYSARLSKKSLTAAAKQGVD